MDALRFLTLAALALTSTGAAPPPDAWANAHTHLLAAQKAIRSVHFLSRLGDGALVVETTYVAPDRLRVETTTASGLRVASVTIGDRQRVVGSLNGKRVVETGGSDVDWSNVLVSQGLGARDAAATEDVVADGTRYGAYVYGARTSNARPPVPTVCIYDKRSYRVVRCASELGTTAFDRYDDPANVVDFDTEV